MFTSKYECLCAYSMYGFAISRDELLATCRIWNGTKRADSDHHIHSPILTLCTPRAHLCARGDFERLAFKYLYALEKDSTAIWCSRQCACVLMRTSVVRIQKEELSFFIFHFGFSNSLIIHKCISRVQRVKALVQSATCKLPGI